MHSVLRNEIIFLVTFVWPLAIPLSLLLAPRGLAGRSISTFWLVLAGPIATLILLVLLARERPTRVPTRAPGRGLWVPGGLLVALLVTGLAIFFHPGWTAAYFRLIDVHVWIGYGAWLACVAFIVLHVRQHRSWKGTLWMLALMLLASLTAMFWNEVNLHLFLKIPLVVAGAYFIRALQRDLGAAACEPGMRAGLAVLYIATVTFATGAYITEPLNSMINHNMGLYALYVHGGVPLVLLPLLAVLLRSHVKGALFTPIVSLGRRLIRVAGGLVFVALFAGSSVYAHIKWFGPDGGLHFWPPSDLRFMYEALPWLSPAHSRLIRADPARVEPVPETPGLYEASMNDSKVCATSGCHPDLVRQWEHSTHRFAGDNVFFRKVVERLRQSGSGALIARCQACHDPVGALFQPQGSPEAEPRDWTQSRGVTCKSCHLITSVDHTEGNGAYTLREEMPYPVRAGEPGYVARWAGFIRDDLRIHFKNYANAELFEAAEFCTACHRSVLPEELTGGEALVLSDRYESWSKSRYAQEGTRCMNCHMAEWRRDTRGVRFPDHRIPGLNVSLGLLAGDDAQHAEGLREFEQFTWDWIRGTGAVGEIGPILGMQLVAPDEVEPGATVAIWVQTTNRRVGHDFPAGPEDLNEVWLELRVTDADSRSIFVSGALQDDLSLDPQAHRLGATLVGAGGLPIRHHEIWRAVEFRDRRALGPDESTEDRYDFVLPIELRGPLHIEARWNYRRARQEFVRWVYGDDEITFPVVPLASVTRQIEVRPAS